MAINFPSSPTNGQVYTDPTSALTWVYSTASTAWSGSFNRSNYVSQTFTATAGQTSFTVSGGYIPTLVEVYQNGVLLVNGIDVTVTSGTVVALTSGAIAGDIIQVIGNSTFNIANVDASAITSGTLAVARGGTGLSSPGTAGNLLTSNGTAWTSTAPAAVASVLTGSIIAYGSTSAPSGYLACDGSVYTKSSYTALSTVLGTQPSFAPTLNSNLTNDVLSIANSVLFSGDNYSTNSGATFATVGTNSHISAFYVYTGTNYVNNGSSTGTVYRSSLGGAGTAVTTNVAYVVRGLAYIGTRVIAAGSAGQLSYSTNNGVAYTAGTTITGTPTIQDGAFNSSIMVIVGAVSSAGAVWTTTDGSAGTSRTLPVGFGSTSVNSVSFINSLFVAVDAAGAVATSSDGTTWTLAAAAGSVLAGVPSQWLVNGIAGGITSRWKVSYNNGYYFYSGYYSTDAATWKLIPVLTPFLTAGNSTILSPLGTSVSDGTKVYFSGANNGYGSCGGTTVSGSTITPFNYTTATQFLVPKIVDMQNPNVYYYIKT
jgi:hypothetical protein